MSNCWEFCSSRDCGPDAPLHRTESETIRSMQKCLRPFTVTEACQRRQPQLHDSRCRASAIRSHSRDCTVIDRRDARCDAGNSAIAGIGSCCPTTATRKSFRRLLFTKLRGGRQSIKVKHKTPRSHPAHCPTCRPPPCGPSYSRSRIAYVEPLNPASHLVTHAEPRQQVEVEDRPYPKLRHATDAIIKVTSTALCGSDLASTVLPVLLHTDSLTDRSSISIGAIRTVPLAS